MSASGIIGTFLGVRSPGTAYVLLHHYMGEIDGAFRSWGFARGGTGAISNAIAGAAREAGVEIRTEHGVARIRSTHGRSDRRRAGERRRDRVPTWSCRAWIPRLTFCDFARAQASCRPSSSTTSRRYKLRGSSGKVNLALDALPELHVRCPGAGRHLRGAISISPSVDLHGARVRPGEVRRVLDAGPTSTW